MASADLGGLGKADSEPVIIPWIPSWLVWTAMLALFLATAVRRRVGWLILLPFAVALAVCYGLERRWPAPSEELASVLAFILGAASLGLSLLWGLSPRLAGHSRGVIVAESVPIVFAAGVVGMLLHSGALSLDTPMLVLLALASVAIPLNLTLAALCCQHRFRLWQFLPWLLFWSAIVLPVLGWVVAFVLGESDSRQVLGETAVVTGVALFCIVLPFVLLSTVCPYYRHAFRATWKLGATRSSRSCA